MALYDELILNPLKINVFKKLTLKQDQKLKKTGAYAHTEKKIGVELTFAVTLTGLLSHLGSNICKTQDQSHSDTTPLFTGHGENFQGEKLSI